MNTHNKTDKHLRYYAQKKNKIYIFSDCIHMKLYNIQN
jgi:hypothetical protein